MSRLTELLDRHSLVRSAREIVTFAYRRGAEVRLPQVAGSLTFTTLLSIVPLFAVALALFAAFPLFSEFREALVAYMQKTLPGQISDTVLRYVNEFASKATRLTAFGLIFLAFTAVSMIMTVDRALNDIWRIREQRPLTQRVLIYWAIITLGPILVGASLTASSYLWSQSAEAIKQMPGLLISLLDYAPVMISGFAYAALYVFVPNRYVAWRDALIGGFVAAVLAEILKSGFGQFVSRGSVNSIYGAFAALPIFLLWMFLSWYVLLFGAAIAATLSGLRVTRFADETRAGDRFVTAVAALRMLLEAQRSDGQGVAALTLARRLRSDPIEIEHLLADLEELGYVRPLATMRRGRSNGAEWLLTCDPAVTTLRPAFERFALDPSNTLLRTESFGLAPIARWIDQDVWLNAPLERSLGANDAQPAAASAAPD